MALLRWLVNLLTPDKKIGALYGYPAGRKTWLTIYHRRKSDTWEFEWDNLFDSGRPKSWGDVSECLMFEYRNRGVTREEINTAWQKLRNRNLA